jgi:hypothetical protein
MFAGFSGGVFLGCAHIKKVEVDSALAAYSIVDDNPLRNSTEGQEA